jgi:hypothetical protein
VPVALVVVMTTTSNPNPGPGVQFSFLCIQFWYWLHGGSVGVAVADLYCFLRRPFERGLCLFVEIRNGWIILE